MLRSTSPATWAAEASSDARTEAVSLDPGRRAQAALATHRPLGVVEVERRVVGEEVHVRLPVRLDGADVAPVAGLAEAAHIAALDQGRQQLVAQIAHAVLARLVGELFEQVQHRRGPEDEHLVRHHVARRLVGLVGVAGDPAAGAVPVDLDDPVARRVLPVDLGGDHGEHRAGVLVGTDDVAIVEAVHRVGAHHHDELRAELADQLGVAPQAVGGALCPALPPGALVGRQDQQAAGGPVEIPGPAVGEMVVERGRLVLLGDPDVGDRAVQAVAQREVDEPVAAGERHGRFGALVGQGLESGALSTGEDEGEDVAVRHARLPTRARAPITCARQPPSSMPGRLLRARVRVFDCF